MSVICWNTVIWFLVFLSNTNNSQAVIWFQVADNNDNSYKQLLLLVTILKINNLQLYSVVEWLELHTG